MKLPAQVTNGINKVGRKMGKTGLKIKKYTPEIVLVTSTVTAISATVMACKATLKANDILDEAREDIEEIKSNYIPGENDKEYKKSLTKVYVDTGVEIAKAYAPSIILGGFALGGIYGSDKMHRERNANLAAAYAAVDQSYKQYRKGVIEKFGESVDKEIRYGEKAIEITEETTDKNGKTKTTTSVANVANPDGYSEYARFFDSSCREWDKNAEYNLTFLRCREQQANDMLQARGYLFLNEVYNMLGIQPTRAGQSVGWIFDKDNPIGDNYVDFGIYRTNIPKNRDFVNGIEPVILLDFNVDGPILSYFG